MSYIFMTARDANNLHINHQRRSLMNCLFRSRTLFSDSDYNNSQHADSDSQYDVIKYRQV